MVRSGARGQVGFRGLRSLALYDSHLAVSLDLQANAGRAIAGLRARPDVMNVR